MAFLLTVIGGGWPFSIPYGRPFRKLRLSGGLKQMNVETHLIILTPAGRENILLETEYGIEYV
jgi:hypothetical protein